MEKEELTEPNLYNYHNYRSFLKDRIDWIRMRRGQSLRTIAKNSEMTPAFLSMIINGKRKLTAKQLPVLAKELALDSTETSYMRHLVLAMDSKVQASRDKALGKLQKYRSYKRLNPLETEVYEYLSHWFYFTIREMSAFDDFELDPFWIQKHLTVKVSISEIREGLKFLTENGFIKVDKKGNVLKPDKHINCETGILKAGMQKFHSDAFKHLSERVHESHSGDRVLNAHICAVPDSKLAEAKAILDEAQKKITELFAKENGGDKVYHFGFTAMPLTKPKQED